MCMFVGLIFHHGLRCMTDHLVTVSHSCGSNFSLSLLCPSSLFLSLPIQFSICMCAVGVGMNRSSGRKSEFQNRSPLNRGFKRKKMVAALVENTHLNISCFQCVTCARLWRFPLRLMSEPKWNHFMMCLSMSTSVACFDTWFLRTAPVYKHTKQQYLLVLLLAR